MNERPRERERWGGGGNRQTDSERASVCERANYRGSDWVRATLVRALSPLPYISQHCAPVNL